LLFLLERAKRQLELDDIEFLADLDRFNLWGRYPDAKTPQVSATEAMAYLREAERVITCLTQALSQ
jgi:HEPN domain-containing protein